MADEELLKKVNRGRLLGLKYTEVKTLLLEKGYKPEQIDEAILAHFKEANKYSVSQKMMNKISEKSKSLAKKIYSIKLPEMPRIIIEMPKFNMPKIKMPEFKMPSIKLPKVKMPSINLPKLSIPKINIPKINLPQLNTQKIETSSVEQEVPKTELKKKPRKAPIKKKNKREVKKTIKTKPVLEIKKEITINDPAKYFYFCNNANAKNLTEFISIVEKLNEDEFKCHVNPEKNDFYNWVNEVIGDKNLAGKIKNETDRNKIVDILKR